MFPLFSLVPQTPKITPKPPSTIYHFPILPCSHCSPCSPPPPTCPHAYASQAPNYLPQPPLPHPRSPNATTSHQSRCHPPTRPPAKRNHPPRPIVGNKESPYMDVHVRHRAPPLTPIPAAAAAAVRRSPPPPPFAVRAFRFGSLPFFYCVLIAHFFSFRFTFAHLSLFLFLFSQTFRKVSTR